MDLRKRVIKLAVLTSFCIILPLTLGIVAYKVSTYKLQLPENVTGYIMDKQDVIEDVNTNETIIKSETKLSTKTLYFVIDEDKEINHIIIELLNCNSGKMLFLTVPTTTKITMSNSLFQTVKDKYVSAPQIIKLTMLYQYFNNKDAYVYGTKIMEETFGVHFDYYTVMKLDDYKKIFTVKKDGLQKLNQESETWINQLITKKNTNYKIKEFYDRIETTFTLEEKLKYLETYEKLEVSDISYQIIDGEQKSEAFLPNEEEIKTKILEFCSR